MLLCLPVFRQKIRNNYVVTFLVGMAGNRKLYFLFKLMEVLIDSLFRIPTSEGITHTELRLWTVSCACTPRTATSHTWSRHCQGQFQDSIARRVFKRQTFKKRCRVNPECKSGATGQGTRRLLHLKFRRASDMFDRKACGLEFWSEEPEGQAGYGKWRTGHCGGVGPLRTTRSAYAQF
jgi:hypothetical protein